MECMRYFEYCGTKALSYIKGDNLAKKPTREHLIMDLVSQVGIGKVNISKLAEGLGVTRQYISKIVNKIPKLRGCGVDIENHSVNQ